MSDVDEYVGWLATEDQAAVLLRASGHVRTDAMAIVNCLHEAGYEIVSSLRPSPIALATAHTKAAEAMREAAASVLDAQQAWHEKQGLWVGASKMGSVAETIRALPIQQAPGGEGK